MTDQEFKSWAKSHNKSEEAINLIQRIRSSQPSRRVQGGKSNVIGRYASKKMGFTIQFESHKVEQAFIREYEFSPSVLEYYDQPGSVKLIYENNINRNLSVLSTPDFFVIRDDGTAGWEECKTESELEKLSQRNKRFTKCMSGDWLCESGEAYAADFGLYFRVRSDLEINWVWQRNMEYLGDYYQDDNYKLDHNIQNFAVSLVQCRQGITLAELLSYPTKYTPDDIFYLIARSHLYVDLCTHVVAEAQNTPIFTDEIHSRQIIKYRSDLGQNTDVIFEPGNTVLWDGNPFTVLNIGSENIWLQGEGTNTVKMTIQEATVLVRNEVLAGIRTETKNNDVYELLLTKNELDLELANKRYERIKPFISGETKQLPTSYEYKLINKYNKFEREYGSGYLGLLGSHSDKGNRNLKLPCETHALMQKIVADEYLNNTQRSKKSVFGTLLNQCTKLKLIPPSDKTFYSYIKSLDTHTVTLSRKGRRAAYQVGVFHWSLNLTTPAHGDRPFEVTHIDHTELDIELVDSKTGKNLGRPWLSLMVDAYSRNILAFYITFESPSYRSCMVLMRECVRRHSRLPQSIVVDGGADMRSIYFETFLACYCVTKKTRPSAQARFGSVLERLFGTTNTQFIHSLKGNTQITKNVRQVTKSVNPANLAIWTLPKIIGALGNYFFTVYATQLHPTLGDSPKNFFASGLYIHGHRPLRVIPYNEGFILNSLPTTKKGTAKIAVSKGIKINNMYYWHDSFRTAYGEVVSVRYDPFNIGVAYACTNNVWVKCFSEYYATLNEITEVERKVISSEIRKRRTQQNASMPVNASAIAAFIANAQVTEKELEVSRKASETRPSTQMHIVKKSAPHTLPTNNISIQATEIYEDLII